MNIIILGPQGSGKGTQAEMLAQKFNLEHIDMGKFLREVALLDTELGRQIHEIINIKRELIDDRILKKALHIKLTGLPREQSVVFDGVPRRQDQLEYFEHTMTETGRQIDAVIFIKLSEAESIKRISKRRICKKCKTLYILGKDKDVKSGICGKCGGKIEVRIDDTSEGVKKRLSIFQHETMPIVEYYKKQGKMFEINGEQAIEKVFEEILNKLTNLQI